MSALFRSLCLVAILALMMPLAAIANDLAEDSGIHNAQSAFDTYKGFEGTWSGEALVVPVGKSKEEGTKSTTTVTYAVIANETAVTATYGQGTPMEMVSLYHMDGPDAFVHTHYCAVGNQPEMRFKPSTEPGKIRFDFARGSNMDVNKDGHVHAGSLRVIDKDTIETETELWRDGKLNSIRYTRVHRQK